MNIHVLKPLEGALSALDLACRIEAGTLTPAAVLERCEQAMRLRKAAIAQPFALVLALADLRLQREERLHARFDVGERALCLLRRFPGAATAFLPVLNGGAQRAHR